MTTVSHLNAQLVKMVSHLTKMRGRGESVVKMFELWIGMVNLCCEPERAARMAKYPLETQISKIGDIAKRGSHLIPYKDVTTINFVELDDYVQRNFTEG